MNVYTYYDDIDFDQQDEIIELWKISWKRHGFNPIILNRAHAQQNPYYDEYVDKLNEISEKINRRKLSLYDLCCFLRWMAYSTMKEENMIVCDYDVINGGVEPSEYEHKYPRDKINMLNRRCPCLSIGTPSQFNEFCRTIVNVSLLNIENIKKKQECEKRNHYHDQDFLDINRDLMENRINIYIDKTLKIDSSEGTSENKLMHFSHKYTSSALGLCKSDRSSNEELRVKLVKEFLYR